MSVAVASDISTAVRPSFRSLRYRKPWDFLKWRQSPVGRVNGASRLSPWSSTIANPRERNAPLNGLSGRAKSIRFQTLTRLRGAGVLRALRELELEPPQNGKTDCVFLNRFTQHIFHFSDEFHPPELLSIVDCFARIGYSDEQLIHAVVGRMDDLTRRCSPLRAVMMCQLWQILGFCHFTAVDPIFNTLISVDNNLISSFSWQDVSITLSALSKGLGFQRHPDVNSSTGRPLWIVLELLVYRARLLSTSVESEDPNRVLIGEVAHYVAPLRPKLAYQLLLEYIKHRSQQNDADHPIDFKFSASNLQEGLKGLPIRQMIFLLSGCQRASMPKMVTNSVRELLESSLREELIDAHRWPLLSDALLHFSAAGLRGEFLRPLGDSFLNQINSNLTPARVEAFRICSGLQSLASLQYPNTDRLIQSIQSSHFLSQINALSVNSLISTLHASCLLSNYVHRISSEMPSDPDWASRQSFKPLWESLLSQLRLRYRQLNLSDHRTLQECLFFLSIADDMSLGKQSIELACRVSRTSADTDTTAKFTVAPNTNLLPMCPKDFEFHFFDVVQIGPYSLFRHKTDVTLYRTFITPNDYYSSQKVDDGKRCPDLKADVRLRLFLLRRFLTSSRLIVETVGVEGLSQ